jgi:hypothetical protein
MSKAKGKNIFEYYKLFDRNVQLFYKGSFDGNIRATIVNYINEIVTNQGVARKLSSIFIELAQNIAYHSAEMMMFEGKPVGIGSVIIAEQEGQYIFATGNIVKNSDIEPVLERCEMINSLDRDGLRKFKREQRNQPQGPHDGAHIGLIQVALISSNPLDISVTPVDDNDSFFSILVKIDVNE